LIFIFIPTVIRGVQYTGTQGDGGLGHSRSSMPADKAVRIKNLLKKMLAASISAGPPPVIRGMGDKKKQEKNLLLKLFLVK
jgi:hypothetical protein